MERGLNFRHLVPKREQGTFSNSPITGFRIFHSPRCGRYVVKMLPTPSRQSFIGQDGKRFAIQAGWGKGYASIFCLKRSQNVEGLQTRKNPHTTAVRTALGSTFVVGFKVYAFFFKNILIG